MIKFTSLTVVALLALAGGNLAQGALIVEFNFNDQNIVPDAVHANATSSNFNSGLGLVGVNFNAQLASGRGWTTGNGSDAITANDTWSFTVTGDANHVFDLQSLSFSQRAGTATGPTGFRLNVLNGANTVVFTQDFAVLTTFTNHIVDLSALNLTSAATIRFAAFGAADAGAGATWRMDNVLLNGAVVPEPSACLLAFALGIPGLVVARRRKKSEVVTAAV